MPIRQSVRRVIAASPRAVIGDAVGLGALALMLAVALHLPVVL